jgi:hypothetical protein
LSGVSWRRLDTGLCGLALGLAAAILWIFKATFRLEGPLGSDAILWLFSGLDLLDGGVPVAAPLYPALVLLPSRLAGLGPLEFGVALSALALVLAPPLAYASARLLGAEPPRALLLSVAPLLAPGVLALGLQFQPDALTLLFLSALPILLHGHLSRPAPLATALLLLATATAPLLREHGLVLFVLLLALIPMAPLPLRHRVAALLLALLATLALPMVFGGSFGAPWDQPWHLRVRDALSAPAASTLGPYADRLSLPDREVLAGLHAAGDLFGIGVFHARHAISVDPAAWLLWTAGLLAALRMGTRRALAFLPSLLCALPALFIWSQPRHLLVTLPAAALALGLAFTPPTAPRSERPIWRRAAARILFPALLVALGLAWAPSWRAVGERMAVDASRMGKVRSFGEALCALSDPEDLVTGPFPELLLFCPRRAHEPTLDGDGADWRTWWIHSRQPAEGWDPVEGLGFPVFRLRADLKGSERPCASSLPAPQTAWLPVPRRPASVVPPCLVAPPVLPTRGRLKARGHAPLPDVPGRPAQPEPPKLESTP